jgi:hypothetical protein
MSSFSINPWVITEINRQHDDLIKKFEMERLANAVFRNESHKTHRISKLLASIGREIAGFGTYLEEHFSDQIDKGTTLEQQSKPGECS